MELMGILEKTIRQCKNDDDLMSGLLNVYEKICEVCDIDKLSIIGYNTHFKGYNTIFKYNPMEGFVYFNEQKNWNIEKYLILEKYISDKNQENFKKLCGSNKYVHTCDFSSIKSVMNNIGFKCDDEENLTEIYTSCSKCQPNFFVYCVFERYNKEKLSEFQINFMSILCEVVASNMKEMVLEYKYQRKVSSRDTMASLLSQRVPMAVVDAYTNKLLRFTDLFLKASPETKTDMLVSELKDISIDLIEKTAPFELEDGREVYLIFIECEAEKIKFDILTEALLYQGFEDYYNNFIKISPYKYILCSLDIDKFKYINSMFGYSVGDSVLKNISSVIRDFIGANETFCRLGEDKFCIFLSYENDSELHIKLTKLSRLFESMKDEHFPDAKITVVNGVTFVDKELPLNILLDQSTIARKNAKGSIKNKFSYYDVEWDLKLQREIELEEQVPHAIANDEFTVYLQPKFNLNNKQICGAEALVRWITPNGMIFPDQFIPLFEKNGFIITLDFIVYEKVMKYIRKCLNDNLAVYPISVNVSRNHIKDKNFIDKFMGLISKYQIPLEYLELEVTESMFVEDRAELKSFIDKIKAQNLKVSIDDFGTAYSSLQTLTDVNIDILKIDKGFLNNIVNTKDSMSSKDKILIKNIINLAKELDFTGLCEGVETDEQMEFLKELGCDLGQGYVFAKPMPISEYNEQYIF